MLPLFLLHHEEVGHFPELGLDPVWESYLRLEELGHLRVFTFREELHPYDLRGYSVFFINCHMHHKEKVKADQDILFIHSSSRGEGSKFMRWIDDQLKNEGVEIVYQTVKAKRNHGKLLERIGYHLVDLVYARRFDHE